MVLSKENFYNTLEFFRTLPVQVDSCDEGSFRHAYADASAGEEEKIVYLFRSAKPVPRLKGHSDVLYIGQTKRSIKKRYAPYAQILATSKANSLKFQYILSEFGPLRIAVAPYSLFGESLLEAEGQLLWWYFQNHCEYPPLNYTKTTCRNDVVLLGESNGIFGCQSSDLGLALAPEHQV